jgi:hypothetical protein
VGAEDILAICGISNPLPDVPESKLKPLALLNLTDIYFILLISLLPLIYISSEISPLFYIGPNK